MTDSSASGQAGLGIVTIPSDEPETLGGENAILHDEHIAYMMQQMANMQSEIDRLRNITNLSISLNTPLLEQKMSATIPPTFPHVNLPTPQHFPTNSLPHKTNTNISNPPINLQQSNSQQANPKQTNPLPFTTPDIPQPPLIQTIPFTQNHQTIQHIPEAHIVIPSTQYMPPVYVAAPQPFTTPIPTMPHPEVDLYKEMEREARPKYTFGLGYKRTPEEVSLASLKRKGDILIPKPIPSLDQSFAKSIATQVLDEVAEDNLVEGLKNLFIIEEEAECNMILKDFTKTPTIWDVEPGDALNNWTCTPSPVLRESW
ncbi:hypothetical protein HAX54_016432 [Datura stramonium]|uniref:Uncharacterized protein n=1 Tax=Datura stramonium TaxID=4076 RepID=A0ABS8Y310_DATST|nr:hypothetical protein [Datura stramonium]